MDRYELGVAADALVRAEGRSRKTLNYTPLNLWKPKPVYAEQSLANEAPTLDGVTLPGGAAVAYAAQGTNGVDIVASFYDAKLDRWSLPRQLTQDEDVESALSLAFDGTNVVLAYLKTQTLRTNTVGEINGQKHELQNIPQPGRTDLYLLHHALGNDVAVQTGSLIFDPPNPTPGSTVTVTVFAVADAANAVTEFDKANNAYQQTVRVVPGWVPHAVSVNVLDAGSARLVFEATASTASGLVVQATDSLAGPIQWSAEPNATITVTEPGRFEVQLPLRGGVRFYRIGVAP